MYVNGVCVCEWAITVGFKSSVDIPFQNKNDATFFALCFIYVVRHLLENHLSEVNSHSYKIPRKSIPSQIRTSQSIKRQ